MEDYGIPFGITRQLHGFSWFKCKHCNEIFVVGLKHLVSASVEAMMCFKHEQECRIEEYDVFGNKHEPDDIGYCECWQCPKQFGIYPFNTWWQPKVELQYVYKSKSISSTSIKNYA